MIVDAGPLYAYVDRDDRHHQICLDLLETTLARCSYRYSSSPRWCIYWEQRLGVEAEVRFLGDLTSGNLIPEPVAPGDWLRIAELVARYRDLPLGSVDSSIVATAERLSIHDVATLDRRHFSVIRPKFGSFNLLP